MQVPMAQVLDPGAGSLSSQVELFVSCRELKNMDLLSKSDPFVVVYARERNDVPWKEYYRSKTIWDNLNPDFPDQILLKYQFEVQQYLRFEIYDRDAEDEDLSKHDFIGAANTTLASIMGGRGSVWSSDLTNSKTGRPGSGKAPGKIIVRGEEVASCKDVAELQFMASNLDRKDWFGFGRSDPFITISRSREDGNFVKVWESEHILKELNPVWKPVTLPVQVLCNGDLDRPLKISVFDWNSNGTHVLIGEFSASMRDLQPGKSFTLEDPEQRRKKGKKYKGSGMFTVRHAAIQKRFSFLDYIRGGCELNLMIGIDFTASNGAVSTPQSLHYQGASLSQSMRNVDDLNEYQRVIVSVGEILQDYDTDGKIPVYGFGGAVSGQVQHCFPLTFDDSYPEVTGIEGVMTAYKNAFDVVSLHGPTLFTPLLRCANGYAREHCTQAKQSYTVLLIITDGVINDMSSAIEQIVYGSELPLSIVIVGVGAADFTNMETLDADDEPLRANGRTMKRDIVQFVPFRKFYNQHYTALAREVLAEIPEQLVSYMSSHGIRPNPPMEPSRRHLAVERSQRMINGGTQDDASVSDAPYALPVPAPDSTAPSAPYQL
ncbi:Copine-5 [Hondaea fermentalgiana]|uniref:Copine-5 n=1 Tax=Hondaea fermentalgiana TaxID=2315210 RepID=A0A2R5GQE4_9STRA|nr:Copine-5 [Hondaea fermentalgiana]|eukprot:GBG32835.1 Copine-5 [Hondaea fermentalgiana]